MKVTRSTSKIEMSLTIELSEGEVRALEAIAGYGHEAFLKVFYEKMGKHYLQPHEKDVISLFETIRTELKPHLSKVNSAREVFKS